ncbi:MAG TPA: DEAD/DEAH box helicase, partial [Conexibacter sp.]|nr:DEAD/DEAH box helicase [Conexibacter sp.]
MSAPTLRPYQRNALDAIVTHAQLAIREALGCNRLLVKKPTGTGKTVMFAAMLQWPAIAKWLETFPANERKMLVIAHREELLDQAADKIQKQNKGLVVSIEQGDRYASPYSDVVIASIQTLAAMKFRRLHRLLRKHTFRIVVVDEAHHAAASTYRTALVHLGFLPAADADEAHEDVEAPMYDDVAVMEQALAGWDAQAPKDRLLVGVTATPNRSDSIGLNCVFQTLAYSYALKQAIDDGWLVPITPWVVESNTSLDSVRTSHGDFNQKDLANTVNTPERNRMAVAAWHEHAAGLSTIAFTVDVQHAHDLAAAFAEAGVKAAAVSGETPKEERRGILAAFTRGDLQVITNCMVLTEGTDLPRTGCILHAKPTKSSTLYEQMTGRGLRIHPGKTECVVIDIVDVARRHSLQTAPVLYGLPPGIAVKDGTPLQAVLDELEALRERYPNFDIDEALEARR